MVYASENFSMCNAKILHLMQCTLHLNSEWLLHKHATVLMTHKLHCIVRHKLLSGCSSSEDPRGSIHNLLHSLQGLVCSLLCRHRSEPCWDTYVETPKSLDFCIFICSSWIRSILTHPITVDKKCEFWGLQSRSQHKCRPVWIAQW